VHGPPTLIGFDDARVGGKSLPACQSFLHTAAQDRLEQLAKGITVAKSAVPVNGAFSTQLVKSRRRRS
jgi:hypothetical protein